MTSANQIKHELVANIEVLLLLVFMVAGIYFMKQLLLYVFTKMLVRIHSKTLLSLAFCLVSAFLSAFLDALTVIAVVISVATGFYAIYHKVASSDESGNLHQDDEGIDELSPPAPERVSRLFAQPDDARGHRHGPGGRLHPGRRAPEPHHR